MEVWECKFSSLHVYIIHHAALPCSLLWCCCRVHYKEYLVDKINKNKLDPVTIYETAQIQRMLERNELPVPEKEDDDTDDQYRQRLIEVRTCTYVYVYYNSHVFGAQ